MVGSELTFAGRDQADSLSLSRFLLGILIRMHLLFQCAIQPVTLA